MANTHSNSQHSSRSSIDAAQPSGFLHRFVGKGSSLRRFLHDDRGMTTIEYAVLLAVIVVGTVALWNDIGVELFNMLTSAKAKLIEAQQ